MADEYFIVPVRGGKTSKEKASFNVNSIFFWGTQRPIYNETGGVLNYGWAPDDSPTPNVVRIMHRFVDRHGEPIIDEDQVVGGYISVPNVPVKEGFSWPALRFGVKVEDVKKALETRIKKAEELLDPEKNEDPLTNDDVDHLTKSQEILQSKITFLDELINKEVEHIILVTAWRNKFSSKKEVEDRLDINLSFFEFLYPAEAFPIGIQSKRKDFKWVNGDDLIYNLFPLTDEFKKKIVDNLEKTGEGIAPQSWEYDEFYTKVIDYRGWNYTLKITFNDVSANTWNKKRATKQLTPVIKPPKKAVEELKKKLDETEDKEEVKETKKNMVTVMNNVQDRADDQKDQGKDDQADQNQQVVDDAWKSLAGKYKKDIDGQMNNLNNLDLRSKQFDKEIEDALRLLEELGLIKKGKNEDPELEDKIRKLHKLILDLKSDRVDLWIDDTATMDYNKVEFDQWIEKVRKEAEDIMKKDKNRSFDFYPVGNRIKQRADEAFEDFKKTKPDEEEEKKDGAVQYITVVNENLDAILNEQARGQFYGDVETVDVSEYEEELNTKGKDAVELMLKTKKWNAVEFYRFWRNITFDPYSLGTRKLTQIKNMNYTKMMEEYERDPNLRKNKQLCAALQVHILIFKGHLPAGIGDDEKIIEFVDKLKNPDKKVSKRSVETQSEDKPGEEEKIKAEN